MTASPFVAASAPGTARNPGGSGGRARGVEDHRFERHRYGIVHRDRSVGLHLVWKHDGHRITAAMLEIGGNGVDFLLGLTIRQRDVLENGGGDQSIAGGDGAQPCDYFGGQIVGVWLVSARRRAREFNRATLIHHHRKGLEVSVLG